MENNDFKKEDIKEIKNTYTKSEIKIIAIFRQC